ncbi:hypothetical protein P9112_008078 [Eukaryota sp. TZLM1-RC]
MSQKDMNGMDLSFVHSATSSKEITLLVTRFLNVKTPVVRSKVPKELRFKIGEADQPARSGSAVRGRGGHFRGHKGRGQYRPIYYINTQEETSSTSSPSENVSASSSMTSHRRIDHFSYRVRNTGNFNKSMQSITINQLPISETQSTTPQQLNKSYLILYNSTNPALISIVFLV